MFGISVQTINRLVNWSFKLQVSDLKKKDLELSVKQSGNGWQKPSNKKPSDCMLISLASLESTG